MTKQDAFYAAIDAWNSGALAALRGSDAEVPAVWAAVADDYRAGYREGLEQRQVVALLPERPEGYYHAKL